MINENMDGCGFVYKSNNNKKEKPLSNQLSLGNFTYVLLIFFSFIFSVNRQSERKPNLVREQEKKK